MVRHGCQAIRDPEGLGSERRVIIRARNTILLAVRKKVSLVELIIVYDTEPFL